MLVGIIRSSCLHNMGWRGQLENGFGIRGERGLEEKGVDKREGLIRERGK